MDGTAQLLESDRRFLVHPLHHPEDHRAPLLVTKGAARCCASPMGARSSTGWPGCGTSMSGRPRRAGRCRRRADAQDRLCLGLCRGHQRAGDPARREDRQPRLRNSSAVYYTTGGAELNEFAFKTARFFWKVQDKPEKTKFISRLHGYHGVTMAAMSATGMAAYHKMFGPLVPGFVQVAPPYPYRWQGNEECGIGAAEAVEKAILAEGPETVAAVIAEPVMGAGGVIVPPDSYFPKLREICDNYDVLLIADEVITGFGRTGRWFALGHWGVEPDIVSFAKGVTSGYLPLGGNILSKRVHDAILNAPVDRRYMHAATYSGHPVCCAVGLRNVEIIESEGLVERAAVMGKRLLATSSRNSATCRMSANARARHDVRRRVGDRQSDKAPALGGRGQGVARGDGARAPGARPPGSADPAIGDTMCLSPPLSTPEEILDRIPKILRDRSSPPRRNAGAASYFKPWACSPRPLIGGKARLICTARYFTSLY